MAQIVKDDARGGMEKIVLRSESGATAEVYLHGAHVVSWKAADGKDVLFTSEKAIFAPPKAIRGGIPVCFPQFGQLGPLGQHGFARNSAFSVVEEESSSSAAVTLSLSATGEEDARFPHPFELRVRTSLSPDGNTLRQELTVKNTGNASFDFTAALHTYFTVPDVAELSVEGLVATSYSDSLDNGSEKKQTGPVLFDREVDRIYLNAPDAGIVAKNAVSKGAQVEVRKKGFQDAVVWNPWVEKARAMADFGDDEYKGMLCIEPAVAKSGAVNVGVGEEWGGWQELVYTPAP